MNINKIQLKEEIIEKIKKWDISGHICGCLDDEVMIAYDHGYDDRDKQILKDPASPYVYNWEDPFFIGLCILNLVDNKKINLDDPLYLFIPEYKAGEKITIFHMLKNLSGIKDYFHNDLMVELEKSQAYKSLSGEEQYVKEKKFFQQNKSYETVMKHISCEVLEYEPGTKDKDPSASNTPILAEVVRRVSGQNIFTYLTDFLFKPLHMSSVKKGSETKALSYGMYQNKTRVLLEDMSGVKDLFTMMPEDFLKLVKAFSNQEIFSKKLWKKILKFDHENFGLIFDNTNGMICANTQCFGFTSIMYFKPESKIAFASILNEQQKMVLDNNEWRYFSKDLRASIDTLTTYPKNIKMVPISTKNFWQAKDLSITQEQGAYVLDAKTSIAMALLYKTKKAYVQMEGETAIGILVLDIDPKKEIFSVDIILIDHKFQGRGYGKEMVKFAVEKLTQAGAKKLSIGVARANLGAKKIYLAAGFMPHSIYPGGMSLQLKINK